MFNSPRQDTCFRIKDLLFSKDNVVGTRWWDLVSCNSNRKYQHDCGRTEYECQLRENSLQDLLGHWAIVTSGFTKTIIMDIIWYFVTIDKVYIQKSIYRNVPICLYSQGFTLEIQALFPTNLCSVHIEILISRKVLPLLGERSKGPVSKGRDTIPVWRR